GYADEQELNIDAARAMSAHMMSTYMCQRYYGMEQYRTAKFIAINLYARISGDRNEAVIAIDGIEKRIEERKGHERLEVEFDEMDLPYVDRVEVCRQLVSESQDRVELEQARMGLL